MIAKDDLSTQFQAIIISFEIVGLKPCLGVSAAVCLSLASFFFLRRKIFRSE